MDDHVIIKMIKYGDTFEYFINFNRKVVWLLIVPKVTITFWHQEYHHYQYSQLIVRLDKDEEHATKALKGRKSIVMYFKYLSLDSSSAFSSVRISRHLKFQSDSNCNDYDSCDISDRSNYDRHGHVTCSFSEVSCYLRGTKNMMNSTTNEFVQWFLWELSNADSNRIFMPSESTLSPYEACSESKCLPFRGFILVARHL